MSAGALSLSDVNGLDGGANPDQPAVFGHAVLWNPNGNVQPSHPPPLGSEQELALLMHAILVVNERLASSRLLWLAGSGAAEFFAAAPTLPP